MLLELHKRYRTRDGKWVVTLTAKERLRGRAVYIYHGEFGSGLTGPWEKDGAVHLGENRGHDLIEEVP